MKSRVVLILLLFFSFYNISLHGQWVQTKVSEGGAIYSIAFNETNIFASSFGSGVFRSTDNGTSWLEADSGLTDKSVLHITSSGVYLFAGTMSGGAFCSTDNGISWSKINSGLVNSNVRCFVVNGQNLFAGTGGSVIISTDNGINWTAAGSPGGEVFSLVVNGATIFAGTSNGVFLSTNNGSNWTAVNFGLTSKDVRFLAFSGTNLFACTTDSGAFRSTDNGTSWSAINNGLTNLSLNALAVSGTNLFTGGRGGVFLSSDNNSINWTAVNSGLTGTYVGSLAVIGMNLFAGNTDGGILRRPLSEMITGIEDKRNNLPSDFALQQNYPNPFNPTTTINYSIAKEGNVNITIYNTIGSKVAIIVNEHKHTGNYSVQFNAGALPSGVYFYRVQAGSFIDVKKMILLK